MALAWRGLRAGSESDAVVLHSPPLLRPGPWRPRAPWASGSGRGAPLLEGSAAVGRRRREGRVGQPRNARCGLCVACPPPAPASSWSHRAPTGRERPDAEAPWPWRVRKACESERQGFAFYNQPREEIGGGFL